MPNKQGCNQPCSARQAEAIALVLRSTGAGRPAAASSAEELVVRLCGSAEATAAVLRARRTGSSTTSPCSEHLVRLSRKSQEREGSCADQSSIHAHWLDWAMSSKANPPKPTAGQSISGDEATENDSQGAERESFGVLTSGQSWEDLRGFCTLQNRIPTTLPTTHSLRCPEKT